MIRTLIRVAILLTCLGLLFRAQGEAVETSAATPEPLWRAAGEGDVATVTSLLDQGLDVDAPTHYGTTALTYATAIPGLGHASPIVWGDQIFIATAVSSAGDIAIDAQATGPPGESRSSASR